MRIKRNTIKKILVAVIYCAVLCGQAIVFAQDTQIKYPDLEKGRGRNSKGATTIDKLSPDLRVLLAQYRSSSKSESVVETAFSNEQLRDVFGITDLQDDNPMINIAVTTEKEVNVDLLKDAGMKIFLRKENIVYGQIPLLALETIGIEKKVLQISATKSAKTPELPQGDEPVIPQNLGNSKGNSKGANTNLPLANEFPKANLTGKGVIVGVIDSGIDWRHPDFLKADGTSRIIAIWDLFDESYTTSGGKIGTSPPILDADGVALPGTIYTNTQINAALKGKGTVNTQDNNGHGTATAGTAAGNGGSTNGKYSGVAPEADLIIVKAGDCGGLVRAYIYGAEWIVRTAKNLKRPVVVNQSFGGHLTAHNGTDSEEQFLNTLTGKGIPGVAFTVSAGNEGRFSLHAAGVFGARKAGQADILSSPITLTIPSERTEDKGTMLLGVFDARDDWGVVVKPSGESKLLDKDGKTLWYYVYKVQGNINYLLGDGLNKPDWFDKYMQEILTNSELGEKTDLLAIGLAPGSYRLFGFGASKEVVNGNFDFYLPNYGAGDFGIGTTKTGMIGNPGNAANVITVGAYNFRSSWMNSEGKETAFNLTIGDISDYSNPGGKRRTDGVYKPDITAPATYTISPLSQTATPEAKTCGGSSLAGSLGNNFVLADKFHIAWDGTSASSPFTAGVIALMLQKNPNLDAEQIRQILIKTARKGGLIGAVPNPQWGYGMLDPSAALLATPLPKGLKVKRKKTK